MTDLAAEASVPGQLLLTGASGWFGKTALWEYEARYGPEALRRDVVAFASRAKAIDFGSPHGPMPALPLSKISEVERPRGLLHLAFLTRDQLQHLDVESYVAINRSITSEIERIINQHPYLPIITTSSGAAAALDDKPADLENNPYATLKQEEERLWRTNAQHRMALVFRIYAASGRFLKSPKLFALGDFVEKALAGKTIVIKSRRLVVRSYVHVGTLMALCWKLLHQPLAPGSQQIDACTDTLSLNELADLISEMWQLPTPEHDLDQELSPDIYSADTEPFSELLRSYQIRPPSVAEQIKETALFLA